MLPEVLEGNLLPEHALCLPHGAFTRLGKGGITDAAASPDENLMAVASHIGVWLYDTHTGNFSSLIAVAETGIVSAVAFSAENTQVAVGDWDGKITLWDINTQEKFATFNAKGHVESIVFSPDGKYMAASFQRGGVILWNLVTGKIHLTLLADMTVSAITFSTDSQILTTVSRDIPTLVDAGEDIAVVMDKIQHGEVIVTLWDIATGALCRSFPSKQVSSITATSSGQLLGADCRGKEVSIWQLDTGKDVASFSLPAHVHFIKYSDNNRLLWLSGDVFTIWRDTERKDFLLNQPKHSEGWLVTFIPGTKHIVSLDRSGTLRRWDIGSDQGVRLLKKVARDGTGDVWFRGHTLTCSSEERSLVTSILTIDSTGVVLQNEEVRVSFTPEITTPEMAVVSAAVSPDLTVLATGGGALGNAITLWNVETGKPIRVMTGHTGEVYDLAFSPDGKHLVSGGARAWEYDEDEDGTTLRRDTTYMFQIEDGKSYYFCFREDGHMDTSAKIWEVATGKCITTLENHGWVNRIAFSSDGTYLVTSSAKYVNLWCPKTWEKLATLDTVKIESLTLSPDGTLLAIGGTWPEQRIQIWNVVTHALVVEFCGHKSDVESVAFSSDGTILASGSYDGTTLLWDMKPYL
ncbi:MAG: WD40 repeat domain-containing protein [Candidatus Poribacteria bacterium]|nr:WD40 repeat domain-containing protein [Candidatus Poribacteria bacterium]